MAYLATPSWVEPLVAKKTYINFSKFLSWVFWRLALATCSRLDSVVKIACFAQIGQFLNVFSFSLELLWPFIVFLTWNTLKLTVSISNKLPFLHHFNSKSSRKRYGFSYYLIAFHVYSMCFLDLWFVFEFCDVYYSCMEWVYSIGFAEGVLLILVIWRLLNLHSWLFCRYVSWLCCSVHIILMVECHNDRYLWICDLP